MTELGLVALLALLATRIIVLFRAESFVPAGATNVHLKADHSCNPGGAIANSGNEPGRFNGMNAPNRTELFTQLHILAGLQDRDCRVNGLILSESQESVRTYATAWLYGASCALSPKPVRHSDTLASMVANIVSRKTGIQQTQALQTISTLTHSSVLLACYRAGLEGAEFWQANHYVPSRSSLYNAVTSNAFI